MYKMSIYGLTYDELVEWFIQEGSTKHWANLVWEWLYRKRVTDFSKMTDVKENCLALVQEHFAIETLCEHLKQESQDGTIKFLFRLQDGHLIETVLMKQKYGMSVCVTTQVGCNMGCSFCASGLLTKIRDLSRGEIVEQVIQVQRYLDKMGQGERVTNVVVMGIGEPFDNYQNVMGFLNIIMDHKGLSIAGRCITLSTCGLVHKIREFADAKMPINLAISLHAPNNPLRTKIMKINRSMPLEVLLEALSYYLEKTNRRRLTIEYILLKGINDQKEQAEELANLLKDMKDDIYVNVIPYNPVGEHSQYERSEMESVLIFYDSLKKKGINCKIRQEHGVDIDAACGQLRSEEMKKYL